MYFNELYENSLTDEREQAKLAKQQKEQEFRNKQLANKLAERANQTGLLKHPIGKDGIVVAIFDEKATLSIYSKKEKEAIKQQIKDMDAFVTPDQWLIVDGVKFSIMASTGKVKLFVYHKKGGNSLVGEYQNQLKYPFMLFNHDMIADIVLNVMKQK